MTKHAFFSNDEGSSCDGHCLLLAPIQLLVNLKQPDQNHRRHHRHCRHRHHHRHHRHRHRHPHLKASFVAVEDRVRAL